MKQILPNLTKFLHTQHYYIRRYQILNPKGIKDLSEDKKASKVLIESTELDPDLYRLGHTKARKKFSIKSKIPKIRIA